MRTKQTKEKRRIERRTARIVRDLDQALACADRLGARLLFVPTWEQTAFKPAITRHETRA